MQPELTSQSTEFKRIRLDPVDPDLIRAELKPKPIDPEKAARDAEIFKKTGAGVMASTQRNSLRGKNSPVAQSLDFS